VDTERQQLLVYLREDSASFTPCGQRIVYIQTFCSDSLSATFGT